MQYTFLGSSDLYISKLGMGAWAIGGQWKWGWGQQSKDASIYTIESAMDAGINWIDTAPVYGLGHSETVIGDALKKLPGSQRPMIFTKCGFCWDQQGEIKPNLTAKSVREEVEASLQRLQIDVIDLHQIHWPNPDEQIEEAFSTLLDLKNEGKIKHLGVSNFSVPQMQRLESIASITSLQSQYNLIERDIEQVELPYCQQNEVGVLAYSPMASGLLTGCMTRDRIDNLAIDDWRKNAGAFNEPDLTRNLAIVGRIIDIAKEINCSPAEVALSWVLQQKGVSAAIVGLRSPEQLQGVTGACEINLTSEDLVILED